MPFLQRYLTLLSVIVVTSSFTMLSKKPICYLNKTKDYVDVAFVQGILFEKDFTVSKNYNNRKQVCSIQVKSLE